MNAQRFVPMLMSFVLLYWPVGTTATRLKPSVGSGLCAMNSRGDRAGAADEVRDEAQARVGEARAGDRLDVSATLPSTDAQAYGTPKERDAKRPKKLNPCPYPSTAPLMYALTSVNGKEGSKRTSPAWYK